LIAVPTVVDYETRRRLPDHRMVAAQETRHMRRKEARMPET